MTSEVIFNSSVVDKILNYIDNYKDFGDEIPMICALPMILGVCRATIYNWKKNPADPRYLKALALLEAQQERRLVNGGLSEAFDAKITGLCLSTNHGYAVKKEQEVIKKPWTELLHKIEEKPEPVEITDPTDNNYIFK